jgi:signal peptidase II
LLRNPHPLRRSKGLVSLFLVWVVALLSAIALYSLGLWFHNTLALCGLGLVFGGSAGNFVDMLRFRFIVDFIDLRWWPVFNIADVAIVAGLVLAFWPTG